MDDVYRTSCKHELNPLERVYRDAVRDLEREGTVYVQESLWVELKEWLAFRYPHSYSSYWIAVDDLTVYILPETQ